MSNPVCPMQRRAFSVALVGAPMVWRSALAQTGSALQATPSQTEGPFYPVRLPADMDHDLLRNGALVTTRGQPAWLTGTVTDLQGRALGGGQVEIWQCDAAGHYHHPGDGDRADPAFQGFGRVTLGADGQYRFRTLRPVAYGGRAPHIHLKVRLGTRELLTTQVYAEGDAGNARDFLWSRLSSAERAALTVPFQPGSDGWQARFPIAVRA